MGSGSQRACVGESVAGGGAHTAAGIGSPSMKRFLTEAHGAVSEATSVAADATTAARTARRIMVLWVDISEKDCRGKKRKTKRKEGV